MKNSANEIPDENAETVSVTVPLTKQEFEEEEEDESMEYWINHPHCA